MHSYDDKHLARLGFEPDALVSINTRQLRMRLKVNFSTAKLSYLIFHPLEAVSRYRDPQLQVVEN